MLRKTLGGVGWGGVGCQRSHTHTRLHTCLLNINLWLFGSWWPNNPDSGLESHVCCFNSSCFMLKCCLYCCLDVMFLNPRFCFGKSLCSFKSSGSNGCTPHVPCFHPHVPRHFRWGQGGCCLQRPTLGLRVEQLPALKYSGL